MFKKSAQINKTKELLLMMIMMMIMMMIQIAPCTKVLSITPTKHLNLEDLLNSKKLISPKSLKF
jgi:hypothetical protein